MMRNGTTRYTRKRILALIVAILMLLQVPVIQISVFGSTASFAPNSLIIPMDTVYQNTGMWKAYGLVYKLLSEGIPVSWAISDTKTFNGADFTATTTDLRTGAPVGSYSYSGGPFIVSGADAAEAVPIIQAWWAKYPGLPVVHEAVSSFTANVDIVLRSAPHIANEEINCNVSIAYYNAAGIPDDNGNIWSSNSPNILDETEIANGGLFTRGACSVRKYDIFVTPHNGGYAYSLTNTLDLGTRTYAELDYFVGQGGGWLACCHSLLSNEDAISDLYKNGSVDVKAMFKSPVAGGFLTENGFPEASNVGGTWIVNEPSMPVAQAVATSVPQALPGGAMQTWDIDTVSYYPQTERIASFTSAGKTYDMLVNGVAHNGTTLGKVTFLGGHSYSTSVPYSNNFEAPYLRFFYNALFFNGAAVAKLDLTITPTDIPIGLSSNVTVELLNTGSSTVINSNNVEIKLIAGATYVGMLEGPAPISITGNPSIGTTLSWGNSLGDIAANTSVLKVQAIVTPTALGETQCSHLGATYGDVFGEQFSADLCRSIHVYACPQPVISKTPETQTVNSGGIASWDLTFSNTGPADLLNAMVEDVLPNGFFFRSSDPEPYSLILLPSGETRARWNVGTLLAGGASQTITLTAYTSHVNVPTDFTNNVSLTGTDGHDYPYEVTDSAEVTLIIPPVNLEKSVSPDVGVNITESGEVLTYSLSPAYNGSALLDNVLISDPVPEYASYITGTGGNHGFTPLPKIDGIDTDTFSGSTTNTITASPSLTAQGNTVTVTMTLTNNSGASITNIVPVLTERLGIAGATISAPSATGFTLTNGASQAVTFSCIMIDIGERLFLGSATGVSNNGSVGDYSFADSSSNTVLVTSRLNASPSNDVVTWRLGSNTPAVPGETLTSGFSAGVYAFRGANTKEFSKFSVVSNAWAACAQPTNGIEKGGSLTTDGAGTIYASEGNSKWFYKYNNATNIWTRLADSSVNFGEGGSICFLNTGGTAYVYALTGNGNKFSKYNITGNAWISCANTPANIKKGGALTTDGTYLYALEGDTKKGFYRYDPIADSWATMASVPANVGWGGSLTRVGNNIFALGGNGMKNFWSYSISGNSWTVMANTPGNVGDGGSLTNNGTHIYALQGKTKAFWRYDIAANTWSTLPAVNFTGNVGQGGSLVYVAGDNPQGLFTTMKSGSSLMTHGDTVTVTFTATSSTPVNDVTASAVTVTGANGASAAFVSGPVLISADNNISNINDPVVFEWTYTANAGSIPGSSVTFTAHATGSPSTTFPTASTQSVLVSPVLTFQARILGAAVLPQSVDRIINFGMFSDNAALGYGLDSNTVITPLLRPLLTLLKSNSPDETETLRPGNEITYTLILKNEGSGIAQNIVISDIIPQYTSYISGSAVITDSPHDPARTLQVVPPAGADPLMFNIEYLNMDESITITFSVIIDTQTIVGTYHTTNQGTVTATGTTPVESNIVLNNFEVIASFGVTKAADPDEVDAVGETVNYSVNVYNTGDVALSSVTAVDPLLTNLMYVSGDLNSDSKLDIHEQWLYTGTYIIQETDVDALGNGTIVNIVTADTAETEPQTATATVIIDLSNTLLRITKVVTYDQGGGYGAGDIDKMFTIHIGNIDGSFAIDLLLKSGETIELMVPCGTYEIFETAIPMEYEKSGAGWILYSYGIPGTQYPIGLNNHVVLQAARVDVEFTNHFEHVTYFHDSDLVRNQFSS